MKIEIKDKEGLCKAAGYMHDSGFNNEDIKYDTLERIFRIASKEYEFKGRFIQRKTDKVKAICNLMLKNVKNCNIKFTGKADKNGYKSIGEDYFNCIKIKYNKVIFVCTFQKIELEVDNFIGELEIVPMQS